MTSITVERNTLLPALAAAGKAVERRSTIPILQNVLLEAANGRLAVTGTDLDIEVTLDLPAETDAPASFTLPAAALHDIVRKLPDGCEIRIGVDKTTATVSAGRSRFTLQILPADDFPRLSGVQASHSFSLDGTALDRLFSTLSFAISTEETRYYLNGIYLHEHTAPGADPVLVAVATDGHRLARLALPRPEGAAGIPGIIVPKKTVQLVHALFSGDGAVAIDMTDSRIGFSREGGPKLTSKLIDGTYPDYQRVIPAGNANRFALERATLAAAIDRVLTISPERGRAVKHMFGPDGPGVLRLAMASTDTGSAEDEVACETVEGVPVEIGFNGRYCLDMLAATACQRIEARLGDAGAPAVFEPLDGPEPRPLFVIMPMRV